MLGFFAAVSSSPYSTGPAVSGLSAPVVTGVVGGVLELDAAGDTIEGTGYPGATITVTLAGEPPLTSIVSGGGGWSVTLPVTPDGVYAATARQNVATIVSPPTYFSAVVIDHALWILADGTWNDTAVWSDAAVWVD